MTDQTPIPSGAASSGTVPASRLSASAHPWRATVVQRLEELVRLEQGWDGYEGDPVSLDNAVFALRLLEATCSADTPAPSIVQGSGGDLQIEWHLRKGDLELYICEPYAVNAWRAFVGGDPEGEELDLKDDFSIVAQWVIELME